MSNHRHSKHKDKKHSRPIEISDSQDEIKWKESKPRKHVHRDDDRQQYRQQQSSRSSQFERENGQSFEKTESKQKKKQESVESEPIVGLIKFNNEKADPTEGEGKPSRRKIIPWISVSTLEIKDSLLRFHNEIIDFYNYIKPSEEVHAARMNSFLQYIIKKAVEEVVPGVEVRIFGSFATKLYLPDSDIDISVLTKNRYEPGQVYNLIHKRLQKDLRFKQLQYIRKSKVPLIKFVFGEPGVQCDISVDKEDGIEQVAYVAKIEKNYPEFKYLIIVFKCVLRLRGLSDTYTGGVGSFLLNCMVLVYLQDMQRGKKYYTLGEHVLQFMIFYGQTDWSRKVIYVRNGLISQRSREAGAFSVYSPQDETHDIGKSAFKVRDVFNLFRNRARYIQGKNFSPNDSILQVLVNPNREQFQYLKANP